MTVGTKTLAQLRRDALLSQAELAERIGVMQQVVGRWESGKNRPRPAAQRALVAALGCTPEELIAALDAAAETMKKVDLSQFAPAA